MFGVFSLAGDCHLLGWGIAALWRAIAIIEPGLVSAILTRKEGCCKEPYREAD